MTIVIVRIDFLKISLRTGALYEKFKKCSNLQPSISGLVYGYLKSYLKNIKVDLMRNLLSLQSPSKFEASLAVYNM